jgi:hypothetical protein
MMGLAALRWAIAASVLLGLGGCGTVSSLLGSSKDAITKRITRTVAPAYQLEVDAPPDLRRLLVTYLDLSRFQSAPESEEITRAELDRMVAAAPAQARELLQTEGYFNAVVKVTRSDVTPAAPAASATATPEVDRDAPLARAVVGLAETRRHAALPLDAALEGHAVDGSRIVHHHEIAGLCLVLGRRVLEALLLFGEALQRGIERGIVGLHHQPLENDPLDVGAERIVGQLLAIEVHSHLIGEAAAGDRRLEIGQAAEGGAVGTLEGDAAGDADGGRGLDPAGH